MRRLLLLLFVLIVISACAFVGENTKTPSALVPTLTSAAQTETPAIVSTLPASPTPFTQEEHRNVNLFCETYIETTWGSGPGQWGWPEGLEYRPSTLLPVKFDDTGRLYFADFINLRLLRYATTNSFPIEISLQPFLIWKHPWPFEFSISIYQGKIFIPYGGKYIGILSADTGNVFGSIQLPGYGYDPYYPTRTVIEVDRKGRLYIFGKPEEYYSPIQSVFFEPGWENGEWKKIELPEDMSGIVNPYFWDDYIVSESYGASTTTILHQSSLEKRTFVSIDTGVPKTSPIPWTPSLFGVDKQGNAYLIVNSSPPTWTYAKYSLLTHQIQVAKMQLDTSYTIAVPSVSPDGVLYIVTYSNKDMSVPPRIIKCAFPNQ